ncbi:Shedu immune nuclease family protein [Neobacillus rhizophilus]|uniref:DUF4263 domain-containing protein n=1 Tax=Neobacillus rhizophilus TaxID=2833579 RepID=A0A942U3A7_9BACI|nr:Shedu immune nuclease family protein [Neobacillus rhizophilus]MBS4212450.1 DUF4263 domain-containing protein [Neobacillus rhizophilus]
MSFQFSKNTIIYNGETVYEFEYYSSDQAPNGEHGYNIYNLTEEITEQTETTETEEGTNVEATEKTTKIIINEKLYNSLRKAAFTQIPDKTLFYYPTEYDKDNNWDNIKGYYVGKNTHGDNVFAIDLLLNNSIPGFNINRLEQEIVKFSTERNIEVRISSDPFIQNQLTAKLTWKISNLDFNSFFDDAHRLAINFIEKFRCYLVGLEGFLEVIEFWENNYSNPKEEDWQELFGTKFPWILSQCFGIPNVIYGEQCYTGGQTFERSGAKYPDFILNSILTNNLAIVEIKTPMTTLMTKTNHHNVFATSAEFSSAIAQILSYKDEVLKSYSDLLRRQIEAGAGRPDLLHLYNPRCLLVIGNTNSLDGAKNRSFEIFRNELKSIDIVTYDELFERIRSYMSIVAKKLLHI